jgi:hypothetical protein
MGSGFGNSIYVDFHLAELQYLLMETMSSLWLGNRHDSKRMIVEGDVFC